MFQAFPDHSVRANTRKFWPRKLPTKEKFVDDVDKLAYQNVKRKVQHPGVCAELPGPKFGTVQYFDLIRETAGIYFEATGRVECWPFRTISAIHKCVRWCCL